MCACRVSISWLDPGASRTLRMSHLEPYWGKMCAQSVNN